MKTIDRTFDATTGKTTDIERDMTPAEVQAYNDAISKAEAYAAEQSAKAIQKAALLAKLNITAVEAPLLLS